MHEVPLQTNRTSAVMSLQQLPIMETRRGALCFLLLLVIFPAFVSADDEVCKYRNPYVPFCKGWSCKAECWIEAKIFNARLQEYRCIRGGFKGTCYCLFCGNHMRFLHLH